MRSKIYFILLFFAICFFDFCSLAKATIFLPTSEQPIWQSSERAIIIFNDQEESLILSPSVAGNAQNYVWIVPTPSKPEFSNESQTLFSQLDKVANNQHESFKNIYSDFSKLKKFDADNSTIYTTNTIKFSSIEDLNAWFSSNSYQHPDGAQTYFNEYLNNDWYYNMIQVNVDSIKDQLPDNQQNFFLPPISLTFSTNTIVYPIKLHNIVNIWHPVETPSTEVISGPNEVNQVAEDIQNGVTEFQTASYSNEDIPQNSYLDFYILANHKFTNDKFVTTYSNWLTSQQVNQFTTDLNQSNSNNQNLQKINKIFFTKLYAKLSSENYNSDLEFIRAKNDKAFSLNQSLPNNPKFEFYHYVLILIIAVILLIISPIGIIYTLGLILTRQDKVGVRKIIGYILESIGILVLIGSIVCTYLIAFNGLLERFGFNNINFKWMQVSYQLTDNQTRLMGVSFILAGFTLLILMILINILQNKKVKDIETLGNDIFKEKIPNHGVAQNKETKVENDKDLEPKTDPSAIIIKDDKDSDKKAPKTRDTNNEKNIHNENEDIELVSTDNPESADENTENTSKTSKSGSSIITKPITTKIEVTKN